MRCWEDAEEEDEKETVSEWVEPAGQWVALKEERRGRAGCAETGQESRLPPEVTYKKPQFQHNLYQECGFLHLISGCRVAKRAWPGRTASAPESENASSSSSSSSSSS
eukprot:2288810-Rhodomonas_salina.1